MRNVRLKKNTIILQFLLILILVLSPCITFAQTFYSYIYLNNTYMGELDHYVTSYDLNYTGYVFGYTPASEDIDITRYIGGLTVPLRTYSSTAGTCNIGENPHDAYGRPLARGTSIYTYTNRLYNGPDTFFYISGSGWKDMSAYGVPSCPSGFGIHNDFDQVMIGKSSGATNYADNNFYYNVYYDRPNVTVIKTNNDTISVRNAGTYNDDRKWGEGTALYAPTMTTFEITYKTGCNNASIANDTIKTYTYDFNGFNATITGASPSSDFAMNGVYATSQNLTGYVSSTHNTTVYYNNVSGYLTVPAIAKTGIDSSRVSDITFEAQYSRSKIELTRPSRAGYTFDYWYDDWGNKYYPDSSGRIYIPAISSQTNPENVGPSCNFNVYAHWTPITANLTFNANGGTNASGNNCTVTYDSTGYCLRGTSSRTGYTFQGWYTCADNNCTNSDHMMYDSNGRWSGWGKRNGYNFWTYDSWSSTYNCNLGKWCYPYSETINLYAHWKPNTYTVSVDTNDISWTQNPSKSSYSFTATYDKTFNVDNINMTGYVFNGWDITGMDNCTHYYGPYSTTASSLSKRKETSYKNLRASGGTVTMKANWTVNAYNLRFDYNPPTGHTVNEIHDRCALTNVTYDTVFEIPTPTLKGYLFNGWNISGMTTNNNVTKRYGTGNPPSNTFPNNKSTAYHACGPTVAPGQEQSTKCYSYSNLNEVNNTTVTFKARTNNNNPEDPTGPGWTPIKYKVTIDPNAGTINGNPNSYEITEEYDKNFQLPTPVRDGYEFLGWQVYSYSGKSDYSSWVNTNTNPLNNVCNRFSAGTASIRT